MKYWCMVSFFLVLLLSGCSKEGTLSFCEGTDTKGAGKNCGERATTGELVMLITSRNQFQTDKLLIKVFDAGDSSGATAIEKTITVDPAAFSAQTDLAIYNEGQYRVIVYGKDHAQLAKGALEVIE